MALIQRSRKRVSDRRISTKLEDTSVTSYSSNNSPFVVNSYPHVAYAMLGDLKTMNDTVTSNYFDAIRRGHEVMNSCSSSRTVENHSGTVSVNFSFTGKMVEDHSKNCISRLSWGGNGILGVIQPVHALMPPSFVSVDIANAELFTLQKAYANASQASFNGMLFAAEAHKVVSMLRQPFASSQKLLRKIVRRREKLINRGYSASKALSSAWLEYRYGWKTLMLDVSNLADTLIKTPRLPHKVLTSRAGYSNQHGSESDWVNPIQPGDITFGGRSAVNIKYNVRSTVRYRIEDSSYNGFLSHGIGVTLHEVPETAWELVPFSFVADWFIGVGQWLSTIAPKPYIHLLSNCTSLKTTLSQKDTMSYIEVNSLGRGVWPEQVQRAGVNRVWTRVTDTYTRSVNNQIPLIPLRRPGTLSLEHSIDSVALIIQKISGDLRNLKKL